MRALCFIAAVGLVVLSAVSLSCAGEQPVAIFHAFDERYPDIERYVCDLPSQGYSHIQISPTQKSNPDSGWMYRYQPIDFSIIDGRGSEQELKHMVDKAHSCNMKVISDVVFNHMANRAEYRSLNFPQFKPEDFHKKCKPEDNQINYSDGNTYTEINCWLNNDLPDLDVTRKNVQDVQKAHLLKLLRLGIDGFRFDAAKHMPPDVVKSYIDYIDTQSQGRTWNYLEVIEDNDTKANFYTWVAAVTDFELYRSLKDAFSYGGDLRMLSLPNAVNDSRSVIFGANHDTINGLFPYNRRDDSYLATAYVLARQNGIPLILAEDNLKVPYVKHGVAFRRIMRQRGAQGKNVQENVLAVTNSSTALMMERGGEGFFVVNKAAGVYDVPALDLTLTHLEGCYRELRNNFTVAVERRGDKKYITRWGTWDRGGMRVEGRDALFLIREPWEKCK